MSALAQLGLLATTLLVFAMLEAALPFAPPRPRGPARRVNLTLWALVFVTNGLIALAATAVLGRAEASGIGLLRLVPTPAWFQLAVGLVGLDLASYLVHVVFHRVPWLWRIHRVHHNDQNMDVTTALRQHPLETVLRTAAQTAAALVLGVGPAIVAVAVIVAALWAVAEHANLRLGPGLDRVLRLLLVTPAMHRVHHSRIVAETDSNFANVLAIWDRWSGTYQEPPRPDAIACGLDGLDDPRMQSVTGLLALPARP